MSPLFRNLFACACIAIGASLGRAAENNSYSFHHDHILGTSLDLTVVTDNEQSAKAAESAALAEIDRLNAILSTYDPESEISQLNKVASMVVSDDLLAVLRASEMWRSKTDEAFSGRIGILLQRWREAEETNTLPGRTGLRILAGQVRRANVFIILDTNTVTRPDPVVWAVDGIAKGYIIDKAFEAALTATPEAKGLLLDIGGDLRFQGASPSEAQWKIGVSNLQSHSDNDNPLTTVAFSQGAVATSGYNPRNYTIREKSYSHILSTKSGWPSKSSIAATVIAPNAITADALATAFMTMNAAASIALVETLPNTETLLLTNDGRQFASSGWHGYASPAPMRVDSSSDNATRWPEGFQLKIDYEVPRPSGSRYRYPYLAIWIIDEDKKLIRSLAMFGEDLHWAGENYIWWRRYGRKEPQVLHAISQPSRRPGHYKLAWNGIDDFGRQVSQGTYTLNIEASRQGGGHSLVQIELKLGEQSLHKQEEAEGEIGFIRISYEAN